MLRKAKKRVNKTTEINFRLFGLFVLLLAIMFFVFFFQNNTHGTVSEMQATCRRLLGSRVRQVSLSARCIGFQVTAIYHSVLAYTLGRKFGTHGQGSFALIGTRRRMRGRGMLVNSFESFSCRGVTRKR